MSKLGDVRSMYGQDLGIGTTNATVSQLKEYDKLTKNMLLISSPVDANNNDIGMPSIFATDYNGNYQQLTYAIHTTNGLYPNDEGYLQLNIDGKTIKEKNKKLTVDTNNLTYCSFNNLGVAKVSKAVSSRTNSAYPIDTFITVDKNGVLYLSDSFLKHIYEYVGNKIYENLYPLIIDNIKGWIIDNSTKYYPTDRLNILSINPDYGFIISKKFTLQYNSPNSIGEEINVDINNNEYPIKEIIFDNNITTVTEDVQSTDEIKLYRHSIDFTIVFYPNYNLQNNIFLDNIYNIKFKPNSLDSNQSLMFYFNQNNVFDTESNNLFEPFKIVSLPIKLNEFKYNKTITFLFENSYRYFEDINYNLEIYYIKSDNENNSEDRITLINQNINNLIESNYNQIKVSLSASTDALDSDPYNQWKDSLINIDSKGVISKMSDSSSLYKYILTYTINGERSYLYENTFRIKYELTNIYRPNNYIELDNINVYQIQEANDGNGHKYISGGTLTNNNDINFLNVSDRDSNDLITFSSNNNYQFIYKIFKSLIKQNSLINNAGEGELYSSNNILGETNENGTYNNSTGFILVCNANFNNDIYIKDGGENSDQEEYTIYNSITCNETYGTNNKLIIKHNDENISTPAYAQYYSLVYPKRDKVSTNSKSLSIISFIKLEEFMFQNQNSETRTHNYQSKPLNYNFNVHNAQGPTCYFKFEFDYAKFIMDHIKLFDLSFGDWTDKYHPGIGDNTFEINKNNIFTENNIINNTGGQIYTGCQFFVGIKKDLIDNVFDLTQPISIELGYSYNNTNDKIISNYNSQMCHEYNDYYMFEINYTSLYYTKEENIENAEYKFNPAYEYSFENKLTIKYYWKAQDSNNYNIFEYPLLCTINPQKEDPDVHDEMD